MVPLIQSDSTRSWSSMFCLSASLSPVLVLYSLWTTARSISRRYVVEAGAEAGAEAGGVENIIDVVYLMLTIL